MLQRKQSVYLLLSAILLALTFVLSFVSFSDLNGTTILGAYELSYISEVYENTSIPILPLAISIVVGVLLTIVCIFLFKNRSLQMRLVRYAMFLKVAILGVIAYLIYQTLSVSEVSMQPQSGILLVLIAFIIDWLAIVAIKKDDDLVKSVDRIR